MARYTFGDSDLAAERLDIVAASFAATSRALLTRVGSELARADRVLDLGCGPGHTTALLRELFPTARVLGLDASAEFAARARARVPGATIEVGDALALDDHRPFDLIYARYLLAHLPDVPAAITAWCAALAPGGILVLEEPESIASSDPHFARYEQIASALVRARGGVFYAGPLIAETVLPENVERRVDEAIDVDVTAGAAAAMFWRNAAVWRDDAIAAGVTEPAEIDALVDHLRDREGDDTRGLFDWRQRQTALARLGMTP